VATIYSLLPMRFLRLGPIIWQPLILRSTRIGTGMSGAYRRKCASRSPSISRKGSVVLPGQERGLTGRCKCSNSRSIPGGDLPIIRGNALREVGPSAGRVGGYRSLGLQIVTEVFDAPSRRHKSPSMNLCLGMCRTLRCLRTSRLNGGLRNLYA
jgi:hypothetical protein